MLGTGKKNKSAVESHPRLGFETLETRIVLSASALEANPEAPVAVSSIVAPAADQNPIEVWVQSLNFTQFNLLAPDQVQYLTTAQVASIPNAVIFGGLSAPVRAAFNVTQVRALQVANVRINLLTTTQVSWLTVPQIQSLYYYDFMYLQSGQIPYLTPAQIGTIPNAPYFAQLSAAQRGMLGAAQVQALNVAQTRIDLLTAQQIGWLTAVQLRSINYYDIPFLQPGQIPYLTPAQIATIPSIWTMGTWTAQQRAALTAAQIPAFSTNSLQLHLFTPQQIGWLSVAQIQAVTFQDFPKLSPAQVVSLTPAQIATIPNGGQLPLWTAAARAALTPPQIQALNVAEVGIGLLTASQVQWLTATQIRTLKYFDFVYLPSNYMQVLTPQQIASIPNVGTLQSWSGAQRAALTAVQVQALPVAITRINQLTTLQVGWLTAAQIRSLVYYDFQYLWAGQIPYLTTAQIASMPTSGWLAAWAPLSRASLTLTQVQAISIASLRIDLLTSAQRTWLSTPQIQSLTYDSFIHLPPSRISSLSLAQIASIPNAGALAAWSPAARAAMTAPQVQSLNVGSVRINLLTTQQIAWLTASQIRSVSWYDITYLQPGQIPYLTAAQIASIPSAGAFEAWSEAARAALTLSQVQALNVALVRIDQLTEQQVGWLSIDQIRAVNYFDFAFLRPAQVPYLTTAQIVSAPMGVYGHLPDNVQAAMTREQILNLPPLVYAELARVEYEQTPPTNYHPTLHIPIGPDGIGVSQHLTDEAAKFFALVPLEAATHRTVASGNWSNPAIWAGGVVPGAGAKVLISTGTTVTFDAFMNTAVNTVRIDGTLTFATNMNTQLKADTIVVYTTGKLHIGTATNPIGNNFTAKVLIADNGPINTAWDPNKLSRGVVSRGEVRMYGKTVTPYVPLAVEPLAGATQLQLAQVPTNWKVGDRVVITGTYPTIDNFGADEVIIRAINGTTLTVDRLNYSHQAPDGFGLSVYVANMSRNIVFESEDLQAPVSERPHMVFFHNPNVLISNIGVYGFGRTDKSVPVNDPVVVGGVLQAGTGLNPRARYAIHFHHTGVNPGMAPAQVRGSVVYGSPGWGYVNHSSNVVMEDNVAYNVNGSAFVTEDGNEIGAMRRNLAITTTGSYDAVISRRALHDFGFGGHGFWFQGPGIEVVDNIAAGAQHSGFAYLTSSSKNLFDAVNMNDPSLAAGKLAIPVGAAPFEKFEGNTAFGSTLGMFVWFHQTLMTSGESVIKDFTSWNTRLEGIDLQYSGQVTVDGARLIGDLTNYTGRGITTNWMTHDITIINPYLVGFEVGIEVPVRRATLINGGYISAVQALYIEKGHDTIRTVNITGPLTFGTPTAAQLQGRTHWRVFLDATIDFQTDFTQRNLDSLFVQDFIRYAPAGQTPQQLFFLEQHPNFVPFRSNTATGYVPDEYLDKTVLELFSEFGLRYAGGVVAVSPSGLPGVYAYVYPTI